LHTAEYSVATWFDLLIFEVGMYTNNEINVWIELNGPTAIMNGASQVIKKQGKKSQDRQPM